MSSGSKKTILWSLVSVIVVMAVAAAVWLIAGDPDSLPVGNEGVIDEITYQQPITNVITTQYESTTQAPETTTEKPTTEAESYVEQFLAEANTYSQTVESTTALPYEKPFFHVVTSGTVTDDNSLEGLEEPAKTVGEVILAAGFRYDKEQGIFYSETDSWQRNFGFMSFYDAAAAFTGMYYDTMRLKFNYEGRDWMFQIWKGRYGITTGGEMGIYYKSPDSERNIYACADRKSVV